MSKKKVGKATSPTGGKVEFEAGWFIMKEFQDSICFRAYDAVQGLGDSYSQAQLQELAFQKYHGSGEDSHGLAEKFMNGIEMFQGIYHDEMNRVTQRSENVLDPIYHLRHDKRIVSDPNPAVKGINLTTLAAKLTTDKSVITGRTIWAKGLRVQAAGRKLAWKNTKLTASRLLILAHERKGGASAAGRKSMRKAAAKVEDQKRETSMLDGSGSGICGQESLKLKTFALRQEISTAMTTTSIVSKYNAMKVSLDKRVALISNRKNSMEKLVFQKPECFDDHEHYYATYVPYKVYMDCETELEELTDQYKDLDDQMLAEIEAINPKNETTSGRKRDSGELSASPTNDLSNEVIFLDDESETAQLTYNDD
ncbi:hypothetical protein IV203_009577 [Nitzschia inconspicua]|uniref:Uncharacterized protein n=1 Tax=Nitzschia inconspicua TaxID=303405 RepID=A0A9K3PJN3_9STRA|nr:hypothetical protein IV203_009577 [Nitzschia inconspicua]